MTRRRRKSADTARGSRPGRSVVDDIPVYAFGVAAFTGWAVLAINVLGSILA